MSSFDLVPIGDLVLPVKNWTPEREAPGEAFTYIDLGAVDQDTKQIKGQRRLLGMDAPSRARQIVTTGDILVSTVRPNLNTVARVGDEFDGATASTGFCVLSPNPDRLDSGYLFHWARSDRFVSEMDKRATGASYPAVSDRIVRESLLPLPAVSEQRRIADILDRADALRAKRRDAIAQLDTLTQAIFLDMFGDPERNSKGWPETACLGDVAEIVSGVTKGRGLSGKHVRKVPYLAVINVQDRALNLSNVKSIDATEEEICRYILRKDDLLLTEGGDPDKLGRGTLWANELPECIHQNHVFRVRLITNSLQPKFLDWLIGSARGKRYFLRSAKQTTGIASINMTQLRRFPLLFPPIGLQQDFAARITSLEQVKAAHESSLAELNALFGSLQHRAFRAEL